MERASYRFCDNSRPDPIILFDPIILSILRIIELIYVSIYSKLPHIKRVYKKLILIILLILQR